MQLFLWILFLIVGLALLVKGADWFVDGAAGVAGKTKIPSLVIGLTVVAFGTSAPELAVSVTSAARGLTDLSVGNVAGSNIANIFLILGLSALVRPLDVRKNSLRLDMPVLLLAGALFVGLGVWGRALSWWDGLILLAVFAVYLVFLIRGALKEQRRLKTEGIFAEEPKEAPRSGAGRWYASMKKKTWFLAVLVLVGLGMVVGGGMLLVEGARGIAVMLGVEDRIIGLTVVAIGTSLPELVTSVVAAAKKETDIAVGNVIGSNIFNIFLVAGVASLIHPLAFSLESNLVDALVALFASVAVFAFALLGRGKLGRLAGAALLLCFLGYYIYLFSVL